MQNGCTLSEAGMGRCIRFAPSLLTVLAQQLQPLRRPRCCNADWSYCERAEHSGVPFMATRKEICIVCSITGQRVLHEEGWTVILRIAFHLFSRQRGGQHFPTRVLWIPDTACPLLDCIIDMRSSHSKLCNKTQSDWLCQNSGRGFRKCTQFGLSLCTQ